jgi:hypothetical protein
MNQKSALESSLDLTSTQHPHDANLESRKVCIHLEIDPPRAWYFQISPNFRTLVILLQVDFASSDEPETVY